MPSFVAGPNDPRCQATTAAGDRCKMRAGPDGWCGAHDPLRAEQRRNAGAAGGSGNARRRKIAKQLRAMTNVNEMQRVLMEVFLEVAKGERDPRVLTALATGARAILDVTGVVTYDEQLAEMRARLADLEHNRGLR